MGEDKNKNCNGCFSYYVNNLSFITKFLTNMTLATYNLSQKEEKKKKKKKKKNTLIFGTS